MDVHRGADGPLTTDFALELRDVHVRFGNVRALDGATLRARARTVHAVLGENGAGKTTLMRVAYGMLHPERGTTAIDGTPVRLESPADAIRAGIGMVHQHFTLVSAMTVAENVALGGGRAARDGPTGGPSPAGAPVSLRSRAWRYDARRTADHVRAIGDATGLRLPPDASVSTLGVGARQRLEIVKALARDARILILDEPTALLSPPEADELLRRLRAMADDGRTIILITHKLREAMTVADEVTVLRAGRTVLHGPTRECSPERLAEVMIGSRASTSNDPELRSVTMPDAARREARAAAGPETRGAVVSVRRIDILDERALPRIRGASFEVHEGEIVGVAAVEGSGHRELLRALAGRVPVAGGSLVLPPLVGFIPEDRHHEALALELPLTENVALRGAGNRRGIVPWKLLTRHTRTLMDAFDIRAPSPRTPAGTLSGGNQQKLVLARELDGPPDALVAENPTRGLDLHATAAIHARLREARRTGMAIVFYSSDVDETLSLADRMLVVFDGTVREVPGDRSLVGATMVGLA